jgi:hypothetical protein
MLKMHQGDQQALRNQEHSNRALMVHSSLVLWLMDALLLFPLRRFIKRQWKRWRLVGFHL